MIATTTRQWKVWNHSFKMETIHGERFKARFHAQKAITDYIDCYYNTKRRHSTHGQNPPLAYELMNVA